ncbi:TonB family protein [Pseudomonas sp. 13B_2.1_Bac1]|uniref:energy transducer TonB n=1 Tax=Pseudomonas sp. 13B_2.1_Bac1 TaxID=2971624 RepID=UPI0021C5B33D|nr:energy transducer TonB [Pseudomonas sp. 13B_2.1_Bac1]MCU1785293.1 TonB family protein [Pseudomonas sp. 13B_2.1_Bac1]
MIRHGRIVLRAPSWLTTLFVAVVHAVAIAWILGRTDMTTTEPVSMPPLVLKIAPPAAPPVPSPRDLSVASAAASMAVEAPTVEVPVTKPLPEVLETKHGILAKVPPKQPQPRDKKPQPPKPKKTAPTATPPQIAAHSTPTAPSEVPQTVAPPPVEAAQKATDSAAQAQGAATTALDALDSWEAQVLARLASAKRYPQNARIAREQDTVTVSFTVAPDGKVGAEKIVHSGGYQSLEEEALDLVSRVSPLPPPPDGEPQRLSLPIDFYLR